MYLFLADDIVQYGLACSVEELVSKLQEDPGIKSVEVKGLVVRHIFVDFKSVGCVGGSMRIIDSESTDCETMVEVNCDKGNSFMLRNLIDKSHSDIIISRKAFRAGNN